MLEVATNPESQPAQPNEAAVAETGSLVEDGIEFEVSHPDLAQPDQATEGEAMGDGEPPEAANPKTQDSGPATAGESAFAVLKYRGAEVPVPTREKMIELAQKGLDYQVKTTAIAPYLRQAQALNTLERTNPELARRVQAILASGQDLATQPPQPQPAAQPLDIIVKDPEGNPVKVPQQFVDAQIQILKSLGIDPQALGQAKAQPTGYDPDLAAVITERQVRRTEAEIKQAYGDAHDFRAAIPQIMQTMASMGIGKNDPRDNPNTWKSIYADLALRGITAPATVRTTPTAKTTMKESAAAANPSIQGGKSSKNQFLREAMNKALGSGDQKAIADAVGQMISHPELE